MRSPRTLLLGIAAAGLLILLVLALTTTTRDGFTLGVTSGAPAAVLDAGDVACQEPVTVPDAAGAFDRVVLAVGTYGRPGPPLEVTVAPKAGGAPLARGRLPGGYPDIGETPLHAVEVGHVDATEPLSVCIRNVGTARAALYGNGDSAARTSSATHNGEPLNVDLNLGFERSEPRSLGSLLGAMFDRAALFRAGWVGAWTYVVLALIALVGVPLLLARALAAATRD
ncbi:MAG TPA: hypothetical protein VNS09_12625 [Solirubrobacter sp.]|nr:hypothetical protein [Solirubrobacter sp.]